MPHITNAMHRSVRRGVSDVVFDSLLGRRGDVTGDIDSVKNTFSSWSNCMAKTYCKWPVIVAIIVASLIVFSVLWCIIRCACCGMSCCCSCFSFLKCCDCCGGCCDGKKDKPMKHLDEPYSSQGGFRNQGYQAPAPMMGGGLGGKPEAPQFAQFEVGKSGLAVEPKTLSEDALPPMPSWDMAAKKHVMTEEEKNAVELGELDPVTGQQVPLMAGAASPAIGGPPSPAHDPSPYGARQGQGVGGNGYMGVPDDAYGQPNAFNNGYRGPSPGPPGPGAYRGQSPGPPGPGGYRGGASGPGRGMGGRGRGYGPPSMAMDGQGRGYGQSPEDQYANNGFGGAGAGYGRSQQQRQNSNDAYGARPYPPQRQYTDDSSRPLNPGRQYSDRPYPSDNFQPNGPSRGPGGPHQRQSPPLNNSGFEEQPYPSDNFQPRGPGGPNRLASPPLSNNSGFDFGTGGQQPYTRPSPPPQQMSYGSSAPPSYATRSPPPQEPAYPGYQPYQAPNQGSRGPPGGGRREPQNWDPVQH